KYALQPGRAYDIFEINFQPRYPLGQHIRFRVLDDDNCISWPSIALCTDDAHTFPLLTFEIADGWLFELEPSGNGSIVLRELSAAGYGSRFFWSEFYDDRPEARTVLVSLMKRIYPQTYERYRRGGAWA